MDEYLEKILAEAERDARANLDKDAGHAALLNDLVGLLKEAQSTEFHDMLNTTYASPKVMLAAKLEELRQNVINGKYDN